jgi:hypothetical protein
MIDFLIGAEPSSEDNSAAEENEVTTVTTATSESDEEETEEPSADEATEEEDSEESEDDEDEAEESEEDIEASDDQEDEDSEEEDPASKILFSVDGEDVTLEEAQRGYLRQADYTQKTQALAEARNELGQVAEGIKAHENTVAEHLHLALSVLEPQLAELANTDWDNLASNDPYEYAEKRALMDQAQIRYGKLKEAGTALVAQRQQQAQEAFVAKRNAESEALRMALPDMADPKKARDLAHSIKEYALTSVGLSEQEAGNMVDHRLIVVLNKARQFDELQNAGLTVAEKKIKKGPQKVISGGKPQSKSKQAAKKAAAKHESLRSTGSTDDLVDILLSG